MEKFYIAYGSNMDIRQMKYRCPDSELLGSTVLDGWELLFKGSYSGSYATIERKKGSKVPALIWAISDQDEDNLDRYEGCPTFYYKRNLDVSLSGGRKFEAMVYIMHEERELGIPSPEYYQCIRRAYTEFRDAGHQQFDPAILTQAVNTTLEGWDER
ncbi:MAG: gamma-glutamylcyclotransferase family protein [Eubacteriaceae bacterium]|nr:gamma-glutamylcyclotransferase family protein [Eubacteriaceae bacterium]